MSKNNLLQWYTKNARDLPWRKTKDPYKIWVSEIFLQQTQVVRVIDFYEKFLQKFPTVQDLAQSSWEEFLPYFQGLGFYSRGKNMLKTAHLIHKKFSGKFPENKKDLVSLPGIGDYTASAILSFAFGKNYGAFDVNLYRVLERFFGEENKKRIEEKSQKIFYFPEKNISQEIPHPNPLPKGEGDRENNADLVNHAFMDLGSSVCSAKKVECNKCPLQTECNFFLSGKIIMKKNRRDVACNVSTENFTSPKNTEKTVVMVIHHQKKYFLVFNKNTHQWVFPEFIHEKNNSLTPTLSPREREKFEKNPEKNTPNKKQDFRHFLKEKIQKKMQITISVRPPFFIEEQIKNDFCQRKEFTRCQILSGAIPENKNQKFFSKEELSEIFLEKKKIQNSRDTKSFLSTDYSPAFIQKILGMKL